MKKILNQQDFFNPLKKEAFVQKPDIAHLKPRFEDWRLIKAQALVTGKLSVQNNKLKVEFRLMGLNCIKRDDSTVFYNHSSKLEKSSTYNIR